MDELQQRTAPGGWEWPATGKEPDEPPAQPSSGTHTENNDGNPSSPSEDTETGRKRARTRWPPRTCRICYETVHPTFSTPSESLPKMFQSPPEAFYESEEGRLIRPCKCKGTQRYVHEGCLQAWRHADPTYGRRNYWQCPTCGFRYRLDRMSWGRIITSTAVQVVLTVFTLLIVVFLLGFVGDYILDLYFDPWGTISGYRSDPYYYDDEPPTWAEHFVKGSASLGLLSFAKLLFSPGRFLFHRAGGGGRPARQGRDRMADVSMIVVAIGVATFLLSVWKGTRAIARRYLNKVAERVLDVQGDDDDDDDDDDE